MRRLRLTETGCPDMSLVAVNGSGAPFVMPAGWPWCCSGAAAG